MFERIVVRRHDVRNDYIDAGKLAETLLFYENVHLLLDGGGLSGLIRKIGADNLLSLVKQKRVTATFIRDFLGTHNETPPMGIPTHKFVSMRMYAHADGRKIKRKHLVEEAFERAIGNKKIANAKAEKFLRHLKFSEYDPIEISGIQQHSVTSQATRDLEDAQYVRSVVETTIRDEIPEYRLPSDWYVRIVNLPQGFGIASNLNLKEMNAEFRRYRGIDEDRLDLPWLVGQLLEVRGDLHFASEYMAELATDPLRSDLIQLKFRDFIRRRLGSASDIETFQTVHLSNAVAIREAINSGDQTFSNFMSLLDKADRFKDWLRTLNPDAELLREYYQAVTQDSWAQRLPPKIARFAFFTGGGLLADALLPSGGVGTMLGVGASAVDAFWLDKLLKGWRPNQFIDGPLKRFIDE